MVFIQRRSMIRAGAGKGTKSLTGRLIQLLENEHDLILQVAHGESTARAARDRVHGEIEEMLQELRREETAM